MLNCFNEGFSDEDQGPTKATQMVPRVTLNFIKAHLDPFDATEQQRDMSPELIRPIRIDTEGSNDQKDSSVRRKRHNSADRTLRSHIKYQSLADDCCTQIDRESYLQQFSAEEEKRPATQAACVDEQNCFRQFKQIFCNSPARRDNPAKILPVDRDEFSFFKVKNSEETKASFLSRLLSRPSVGSRFAHSNVQVLHHYESKRPVDVLEFSPERNDEMESVAQPETSQDLQQQSLYVMEPISMNTPMLRKRDILEAGVQGVTQNLTLADISCQRQEQIGSIKENHNKQRKSCLSKMGKKAKQKLKDQAVGKENETQQPGGLSFVGISKRNRF